jgi:sulfur-carrier protein adenylyltransferase/sulfurtransferase
MSASACLAPDPQVRPVTRRGTPIWRVLDQARWAPSGDNTQVWRFRLLGDRHAEILGHDTRDHVVYDRDGHASHIALGALIETVRIAATAAGLRVDVRRVSDDGRAPRFVVGVVEDASVVADDLAGAITTRCTNRRAFATRRIDGGTKRQLDREARLAGLALRWHEGLAWRWRWARVMWANAGVRLTCREAWSVHREVLDFDDPLSRDRVPVASVGADPVLRAVMAWAMADWNRLSRLNRWAGGTIMPRLEMDVLPALACAAHVAVVAPYPPTSLDDHLAVGRAVQRVWLRATLLGLQFQPEHTPLCFAGYVRAGRRFAADPSVWAAAQACTRRLDQIAPDASMFGFLARIGHGHAPRSRSTRLELDQLLVS